MSCFYGSVICPSACTIGLSIGIPLGTGWSIIVPVISGCCVTLLFVNLDCIGALIYAFLREFLFGEFDLSLKGVYFL